MIDSSLNALYLAMRVLTPPTIIYPMVIIAKRPPTAIRHIRHTIIATPSLFCLLSSLRYADVDMAFTHKYISVNACVLISAACSDQL